MPLDRMTPKPSGTGSISSPIRSPRLTGHENASPQSQVVEGVRRMQAQMRKNLPPDGQSDRETLNEIYRTLDDEGFNLAVDQIERPN